MTTQERWRLLRHAPAPGAWNMAVDEVLLEEAMQGAGPVLRVYSWRPYALSIGRFQAGDVVDRTACAQYGVDVVRRPTGGRAVLHADEVTYSIILPPSHPIAQLSVIASYQALSRGLTLALAQLGIVAHLARPEHRPGYTHVQEADVGTQAACFDAPSWYELTVQGRKLVGSAQVRRGGALLQHGSMPLTLVPRDLYRLLCFHSEAARERAQQAFAAKAAGLRDVVAQECSRSTVVAALIHGMSTAMACSMITDELTPQELSRVQDLTHKHADPAWVWRRSKE